MVWPKQDGLKSVRLEDFWGGSRAVSGAVDVAPAFTKDGKGYIDAFVLELEAALPDPGVLLIARQKIDFAEFYRNRFTDDWRAFALQFPKGAERLSGYEEWLPMGQEITSLSGPYLSLLDQMGAELSFVAGMENESPGWISLVLQHQAVLGQSAVLAKAEGGAFMAKAGMKSQSLLGKIGSKLDTSEAADSLEKQMKSARALLDYQKSLKEAMLSLVPRKAAFAAAAAVFDDEKTASAIR